MDASNNNSKTNLIRKFTNKNIIDVDDETLEADMYQQSVTTNYIKVNGGTAFVTQNYDLRILLLPSSGYAIAKDCFIPSYKLFKHTIHFEKIKRVFLVGFSHLSIKQAIYLSPYYAYEASDNKKLFEIDHPIYAEMMKNEVLKKVTEKFEVNTYTTTILVEENGSIQEKEEEFNESVEDNECTFDIHLAFLSRLFQHKIRIVPIWINLSNSTLPNIKEILSEMGNFLNSYLPDEENFFIYSTNLTYFGRLYNYLGDGKAENKEFRSKSFLRDPANEQKAKNFIKSLDEEGLDAIMHRDVDSLLKISNFNFVKELLCTLINFGNDLKVERLNYQIKRYENIEEGFELNLVSFANLIFYYKKQS